MLFNVDIVNLLLKKQWEETQSISFYFRGLKCCGCQGGGRGVGGGGVTWSSRKSYLGLPEISSVVYLVKFKDSGHRVSCCFYFS